MNEDQVYDKLYRTILKYGSAMVIIEDPRWAYDYYSSNNRRTRVNDMVKRIINKDGKSKVAYKGHDYNKYSRYRPSCFVYDYCGGKKKGKKAKSHWSKNTPKTGMTLRGTLRAMRDHDQDMDYKIVEIRVGKGYRQVVK